MSSIRVICRIRPENQVEKESGGQGCIEYSDHTIRISLQAGQQRAEESHEFTFDRIVGPNASQIEVYDIAASTIVEGVLDGYNGTIFAYGQTGSGKTFTMEGPDIYNPETRGIIPRMMGGLFEGLINASETCEFSLKVCYLELYLERIQDLLNTGKQNLVIKEDRTKGIYVKDATEVFVSSPEEMLQVMTLGASNRAIASTRMNQRSSRSHSIFIVYVDQNDTETGSRKNGKMYFVDLAGSEKVGKTNVKGKQLEEAKMINKSLSALGNVINALTEKANGFIPYRDSKLTRILQESLGGNSQTTLVIACTANSYNDAETLSTLRFGQRAKKIQNKPIVNQERSAKELLRELDKVKQEVTKQGEIINNIQTHVKANYCGNQNLVQEINGIIDNSFAVTGQQENIQLESEHSMTLLKQHCEIVNLNQELQQVKLEKKELEDDLNYRNKEMNDLLNQVGDYQIQIAEMQETHKQEIEELQNNFDKSLVANQQQQLDLRKLKKACERLRSDIMIVRNEIPQSQSSWHTIIIQALNEALPVITEVEHNFFGENCISFSQNEEDPILKKQLNKSMPNLREFEQNKSAFNSPVQEENEFFEQVDINPHSPGQTEKILSLTHQLQEAQDEISELNLKVEKVQESKNQLESVFNELLKQYEENQVMVNDLEERANKAEQAYNIMEKQLEQKVINVEEERSAMNIEIRYRDQQIEELQFQLEEQTQQLDKLISCDSPKKIMIELENQNKELYKERQELFEQIRGLRKSLDQRDEQLYNAEQRNRKLERQIQLQSSRSQNPVQVTVSGQNKANVPDAPFAFGRRIAKPIKGGGGDVNMFANNNKGIIEQSIQQGNRPIPKKAGANSSGGIQSMFKGFLNTILK